MSDSGSLFRELKPDVGQVAEALFDATKVFLRNREGFLPHGAVLTGEGEVCLIMACDEADLSEDRLVSPAEALPQLHEALRLRASQERVRAIGVCESVRMTMEGEKPTHAIKVLLEHRRGLCVALYLPYKRSRLLGIRFGEVVAREASPEVAPWREMEAG